MKLERALALCALSGANVNRSFAVAAATACKHTGNVYEH